MNQPKGPTRSPKPVIQWILQLEDGRTLGPLKTDEVLFRIKEGILTGDEKIKKYPDGLWMTVSREPIFYDQLLEALEKKVDENKILKAEPVVQKSTIPVPPPKVEKTTVNVVTEKEVVSQNPPNEPQPFSAPVVSSPLPDPRNSLIATKPDTTNVTNKINSGNRTKKNFLIPGIFLGTILLFGIFFFGNFFTEKSSYIQLQLPKQNLKVTIDQNEQQQLFERAQKLYFQDQIVSYLAAQKALITLIEGNPQHVRARGLLCLVHKELWPFTKQGSKEIDVFQTSRRAAKLIDPVGESGVLCEISYLMSLGKYQNAMGLADHYTNNPGNEVSPYLFIIKSELYAADRKYTEAIAYAADIATKMQYWSKPYYLLASFYSDKNQFDLAIEKYNELLKVNPKHRNGLIDFGTVLFKAQNIDEALQLLIKAEKINGPISNLQDSKLNYFLAKIYQDKKMQQKAFDHAMAAFQANPSDIKTRDLLVQLGGSTTIKTKAGKNNELMMLGDQYYRAGDCFSAQAEYRAAFDFDPQNALAATKAARCLWQLSQIEDAYQMLASAIIADPKFSWPYYLLADYYSQRFSFADAAQVLSKASQKISNNAEILKGFGLIEFRRRNYKDAIAYLEKSRKFFDSDSETLVLLAKSYSAKSEFTDFEKAMQMSVKAIELEDTNSDAHVAYAKVLVLTKGVDSGVLYIKELLKKYSYNQEIRLALAQIYKEAERFPDAKATYEHALLYNDKNKEAMIGLGESYQGMGQFSQAISFFLRAAVLDPMDSDPLVKAGLVFLESGRPKEAIAQFERANKLNPNYPRVNYLLGRASFQIKDFTNALRYAANEKLFNPNLADPYILAGEVYFAANDFIKCTKEYEQVIKLRTAGAENYVKLAVCHLNAGNLDIAESFLTIADQQESGFADIHKVLGETLEKKGERAAAAQAYRKYLTLSPNAPDKKAYERRIEALGSGK